MKKLLGITLLTALALAATDRPAHAWVDSKFSIGLNWHYQSGGNCLFWGAWRNGQVPGPWGDGLYYGPLNWPASGFGGPTGGIPPAGIGAPPVVPVPGHAGTPAPAQQAGQGVQPTGYYYPGYDYSGYYGYSGYTGIPSYWYGR